MCHKLSHWMHKQETRSIFGLDSVLVIQSLSIFYVQFCICVLYLVKIGSSQYFFWSPKTWAIFFRKPREKPFLSDPVLKTGALNASADREQQQTHRTTNNISLGEKGLKDLGRKAVISKSGNSFSWTIQIYQSLQDFANATINTNPTKPCERSTKRCHTSACHK